MPSRKLSSNNSTKNSSSPSRYEVKKASSFSDLDNEDSAEVINVTDSSKAKEPVTLKKVLTRTITAIVMFSLYLGLLYSGHLYCIISVMLVQVLKHTQMYREIVNVRYVAVKERSIPWFRSLQWSWFFLAMFFVYGNTFHKFCTEHRSLHYLLIFTENIDSVVYGLYWTIFIVSVLTLKQGMIRFQLSQHMWSVVTVCLVVFQSKFHALNMLNGLFWFFFPFIIVIVNDVSAYFSGITFGKKFISAPFLALSPNKTWEGFIGGCIFTMIFSFIFPAILAQYSWFICPADGLHFWPSPPKLNCIPNPVFIKTLIDLPILGPTMLYPMQLHGLAYGLFASLVAPFGGFFASAIKRAYGKKDFDSFMPGHGGMVDRMDCQLLMNTFTAFYYFSFIAPKAYTIDKMMFLISKMTIGNQEILWNQLGKELGKL